MEDISPPSPLNPSCLGKTYDILEGWRMVHPALPNLCVLHAIYMYAYRAVFSESISSECSALECSLRIEI